jgi:hypothetical protein
VIHMTDHAIAPRLVVPQPAVRVLGRVRSRSAPARPLLRAFAVIADLGALTLMAWLLPFVILAIASPVVLAIWAFLAIIHRL